jgi:pantetheine-phosphate adenylyltransferase
MKIAVFAGSFDPFTLGHYDIVMQAMPLFDKIIIGIGNNADKKYMFTLQQRTLYIKKVFNENTSISVQTFNGLTVDFCKKNSSKFILRGLRTNIDFEYEKNIAQNNALINTDMSTVFMIAAYDKNHISSTIVRDIMRNNGDANHLLPAPIADGSL